MSCFKGVFGALFLICGTFVMILYLMRMSNGASAFIGVDDILFYITQQDYLTPFYKFYNRMNSALNSFKEVTNQFANINNIGDFFVAIGSFFVSILDLITLPVQLIYYLGYFIFNIFANLINFFGYVAGFIVPPNVS